MSDVMISARGLTRQFATVMAADDLSFDVSAGEVFGLLGPNGAGKTTTIRMLSALIAPTAGSAQVSGYELGQDDNALRRNVGILTESPGLYDGLSAERNLAFFAKMYDVEDIPTQVEHYLRLLGLWERRHESVSTFSKGMRQKLAIGRALLHEPKVLYLDEPTSGLDPEMSRLVRAFISDLSDQGRTIVLSTHNLDEADRLCDRIGVIQSRLLALDTPKALRRSLFGRTAVFHLAGEASPFAKALADLAFVQKIEAIESRLVVKLDDLESHNPLLIRRLVEAGADIQFVSELRRSLEDVYLQLVQQNREISA